MNFLQSQTALAEMLNSHCEPSPVDNTEEHNLCQTVSFLLVVSRTSVSIQNVLGLGFPQPLLVIL